MPLLWYIGIIAATTIGATLAAMMGIGGGVFYTPTQLFLGIDIHQTATTSLVLIAVLSLTTTIIYRQANKIDWKLALVLESATATGSAIAGYCSGYIPSWILEALLCAILIFIGIMMILQRKRAFSTHSRKTAWYYWHRTRGSDQYSVNLLLALPISFVAGILSALVGIGGGIIKVPLMALVLGIPMGIAIATSAFMVGITALAGFMGHLAAGHWNWELCLILIPGVFIGARIGAKIMLRMEAEKLKRIFGVVVLAIAAMLVYRFI